MRLVVVALTFVLVVGVARAQEKYALKKVTKLPPAELAADIQKLLGKDAFEFKGKDGKVIAEIWLAKTLQTEGKAKKGAKSLTYEDLPVSTILGAVRFAEPWSDYRKQKIKPGVYTLRLAIQPMDGDHMGTAPYSTFALLVAPKFDTKAGLVEYKGLVERSAASIGTTHPAVFLLFPAEKATAEAKLVAPANEQVALSVREGVAVDGQGNTMFGIVLTLVGHTAE
jgi:hypothetical protein